MQQIAEWLEKLGLGQYAQRFAENDIDPSVLRDLTDHDLEKIGVSLGHRRRILRAIAELDEAGSKSAPAPRTEAERRLTLMFADLVGSTALSRMVRSPVEICLGTRPSQAAKSRPLVNTSPAPIAATIALEMIGPMPGTLRAIRWPRFVTQNNLRSSHRRIKI